MDQSGDRAMQLVYLVGVLILVGSAVAVRRMPIGQTVKMAIAWILIFAVGFAIFALRDDFRALGGRILADARGAPVEDQGGAVRIARGRDGHYWVDARIDRTSARFLIDSGATVTTISRETAGAAGIVPSGSFPVLVDTANGTVTAQRGQARSLRIGSIERRDLAVHIADGDSINVVGMNFLETLSGWGVEDGALVLRP
jgi:aspartyl protease family protein